MISPTLSIGKVHKTLLIMNSAITVFYLSWWLTPGHIGNPILYGLLLFGEIYHVIMALTFWHTIWPRSRQKIPMRSKQSFNPSVAIFIPVAGEPISVIRATVNAAKNIAYEQKTIYILNDGFVAKKDTWQEVEALARELSVQCITRKIPGGAKAGNINNALKATTEEIIVIFDADMMPFPEFLHRVIPPFQKRSVGFVQTPQYYKNQDDNLVTKSSWEQQAFFFGPIMQGKGRINAAFICGTNVAIRRRALEQVGGMTETNIAEDFLTSLFIHQRGWESVYLTDVLSVGLAPQDLQSYYMQQLRWARGSLEILFGQNPLFKRGLTFNQKIAYLSSALYYFNGLIILIDILMPVIYLFTGIQPVSATTTSFALFFIPFMVMNLFTLYLASDKTFTFRAISFSQSSFTLQLTAIASVIFNKRMSFRVTPKEVQQGNFIHLALPHVVYTVVAISAIVLGISKEGVNSSIATNIAWAMFNISMFVPFVRSSYSWKAFGKKEHIPIAYQA